jgi:HAE1 family hydrophobic/amphiphilic exporter-1
VEKSNPYNTLHRLRQEWQMPPGCDLTFHAAENIINRLFHVGQGDLEIAVYGSDLMILQELQNQVREQASAVRGITDIWTTTTEGAPEVRILIDRHRAGRYGISIQHIIEAIQHNVQGIVATQLNEFDRKTDILLRPTSKFDVTWDELLKTRISMDSSQVPLSTFIDYEIGQGPIRINRQSQARRLTLYADISGRSLEKVIDELQRRCAGITVAPGFGINIGGVNEEMKQSFRELFLALVLALILVYMILAAQFESLRHPFLIILSIPMGLGGVIWALLLTGTGFNVLSFIGTVALAGIAVNDAIVKISFINQRRAEGLELRAAIIDAGRTRFRPIIMTSITTIFGLLPMALSHAPGGFLGRPLAVAIIGGLFSSTLLTLIVVPVFYFLMESNKRLS